MKKIFFILILILSNNAIADINDVTCLPPTEREDGTVIQITEIKEFRVYYGNDATPGVYQNSFVIPGNVCAGSIQAATVPRVYVITAVDTDGRESAYSTEGIMPPGKFRLRPPTGSNAIIRIENAGQVGQ